MDPLSRLGDVLAGLATEAALFSAGAGAAGSAVVSVTVALSDGASGAASVWLISSWQSPSTQLNVSRICSSVTAPSSVASQCR